LGIEEGGCLFCDESEDNLEHYIGKECEETRDSFEESGKDKEILRNLWIEDF
ncbi:hypothetical protein ALC53_04746, partial [Atta colombica]